MNFIFNFEASNSMNMIHKILVVDDEKKSRDFIAALALEQIPDAEITSVESSPEALQLLQKYSYDLLFLDIEMPQMNGLEMLEKIRTENQAIFVVIISAYGKFQYAQDALELGAIGYCLKPFSREKLHKVLQTYRDRKSRMQQQEIGVIQKGNTVIPITMSEIIAVEKQEKNFLKIFTANDCLCNVKGQLNEIYDRLPANFVYINRQVIINLYTIKQISDYDIILSLGDTNLVYTCSRENRKRLLTFLNVGKNEK